MLMIGDISSRNGVHDDEHLQPLGDQVEDGLFDTNMRLDTDHDDLVPSIGDPPIEPPPTASGGEFKFFFGVSQSLLKVWLDRPQALRVLHRGGRGDTEAICSLQQRRRSLDHRLPPRDRQKQTLLQVDDQQSTPLVA